MSKPADGFLTDESVHLCQKALYVEPLNYPLDLEKFPADGHEYIHRVRLEEVAIFPDHKQFCESIPMFEITDPPINDLVDKVKVMNLSEWKNKEAIFFSHLAIQLKSKRRKLMKKFPRKQFPSVESEKDFCLFCLGSELYQRIYACDEKVDAASSHAPFLSIVLHLSQEEIFIVLEYMFEWLNKIEMNHTLGRWIYALLACLQKPVSDECEEFLENFYDTCVSRLKSCDLKEKNQLHLIASILKDYFCVKAYTIGPSLDKFLPLC